MIKTPLNNQTGRVNLLLALAIFFGFGTALFGGISIYAWSAKTEAETNINGKIDSAVSNAVAKQKAIDKADAIKAAEQPYRTYTADGVFGGFSIDIPKSWNLYAEKSVNDNTQLTLLASPDVVTVNKVTKQFDPFQLLLLQRSTQDLLKSYQERIKTKKLTNTPVKVSGINGYKLTGYFADKQQRPTTAILVPVRDKTLYFANEDLNYTSQFDTIVNSAKITP